MNKTVILTLTAAALLSTTDAVAQLKYPATAKDNTVDEIGRASCRERV